MTKHLPGLLVTCGLALFGPAFAGAEQREGAGGHERQQQHFDANHGHNHFYVDRGVAVHEVPHTARHIEFRGDHYWFDGGVWYRGVGPRFVVVAPPFGIYVPLLPAFATVLTFGGLQYYYANDTYYLYHSDMNQYEVVAPPVGVAPAATASTAAAAVFVYPKNGQDAELQARDKYECYRWAVDQTGFDSTKPDGGVPAAAAAAKGADFRRAQQACLEGRGYTVR